MQQVAATVFDIGAGTQAPEQDMVSATVDNTMMVVEGIQIAHRAHRKLTISSGLAVFECSCWRSTTSNRIFDHGRQNVQGRLMETVLLVHWFFLGFS